MNSTRQTGNEGEDFVCGYISEQGMRVLARNYHWGSEEIDIIARDGSTVVFIEVKYRSDRSKGLPAEAVTKSKQKSIAKVALAYLKQNRLLESHIRFDVAGVLDTEITYIKNAFDTTGLLR